MAPKPGLLFVLSHVVPSSNITEAQYDDFYNNEHVPDVLESGISGSQKVAMRYKNINPDATDPYLALYPIEDSFSIWSGSGPSEQLESLKKASTTRTFDNADIYTIARFSPRLYEKIQTYEAYGTEGKSARGQTIVCVAMEPGGDEQDFDEWYRKQHLDMLGMCKGYLRCTRYKRLDGQKPTFLALHEYDCKSQDLPADQIKQVVATEWSTKIIAEAKVFDRDVFELTHVGGDEGLKL